MRAIRRLHLTAALLIITMLAACAQLGMQTPATFNQRVAAGYTTVQTVAESATVALQAGKLSRADAANIVTTSRTALDGLAVAQTLHAGNAAAGEDRLAVTLAILQSLQAYLATHGAK